MRTLPLLFGVLALAGASCSTLHRFHETAPGLEEGAWRIGGFLGGLAESSELSGIDDESSSMGFDLGRVIGESGEFGLRITATEFDDADADVLTAGPYGRWYFAEVWNLRPLLELSGALAGIDFGPGDDTGWSLSAGGGILWLLHDRFALEAVLRQTYGDFETGDDSSVAELTFGVSMFF